MKPFRPIRCVVLALWIVIAWAGDAAAQNVQLTRYDSKSYTLYTDVPRDLAREALLRMELMAAEYRERTREFSGQVRGKIPYYLYRNEADYYDAGGRQGSAGFLDGERLVSFVGDRPLNEVWNTVQHEGFHQYCRATMPVRPPIWVEEGLAEYFGEAVFAGDVVFTGLVPPQRVQSVKNGIQNRRFGSLTEMMRMRQGTWNRDLRYENYDQAWSMVQFLAHGEGGKYQRAFSQFIIATTRGVPAERAWNEIFGDPEAFSKAWEKYWLEQDAHPTAELYARSSAATFASLLGRATSQKQVFADWDAFAEAGKAGTLQMHAEDWLPRSMFAYALWRGGPNTKWSIETEGGIRIVGVLENGTHVIGRFTTGAGRIRNVTSEIDRLPGIIAGARNLIAEGKGDEAKALLQEGIRKHPRSSYAAEAKKLLAELK